MSKSIFTQRKTLALALLIIMVTLGICLIINAQLAQKYLQQQVTHQTERMEVYRNALNAVLDRYAYLPAVLSQNDELFQLAVQSPQQASQQLAVIRNESGVNEVYIMRPDGMTIAASNLGQDVDFVGNNFSYRPYFTEALKHGRGHFYAIGTTSNIPGYFVATRYPIEGPAKAVIVIKVTLDKIENNWPSEDESVFVSDPNGVIILSSHSGWRYKTLQPLLPAQKQLIDTQQQFAEEPLSLLNFTAVTSINKNHIGIDDTAYVHTVDTAVTNDWKVHYLTPYAQVRSQLYAFWSGALLLLLAGLAVALLIRTLNIRNALRHSQVESSKLRKLNQSLEHEIVERKQVEAELRQTQADLRRSSKLAAMGQLSASITHELSQPLAAMKTYLASLGNQLQPDATNSSNDPRKKTLAKLTGITERMITISQQLRYFARSSDKPTRLLDLKNVVRGALNISQPAIQQAGAKLVINAPQTPVNVVVGQVRMEQVVVNLISNALDAMADNTLPPLLTITLKIIGKKVVLSVTDNGPGLPSEGKERLFEPFYSTKPSGVGMGLGLAISGNIIAELGGSLDAENRPQGGARFIITLPLYTDTDETEQ